MGNVLLNDWTLPAKPIKRTPPKIVRARYDAAVSDDDNERHWANADALSARQANSVGVRESLRNRSRYEVANNCYARGIGNMLANIVIGYGPTLTLQTDPTADRPAMDACRRVCQLFNDWAAEVDLWGKLWLLRLTRFQDGEAFAIFRTNPALQAVELDLQLVEAEQVTDGYLSTDVFDPRKVDGIETDDLGNPTFYKVLKEHPGDGVPFEFEPIKVRASQVIHYFRQERPGQLRGIPETTPALPLFSQLRRYTLAVLTAAETAADFAALLKSSIPPDETDASTEPFEIIEINRGMLTTLPDGFELNQLRAEQPTTTYPQFKEQILMEIGAALNLPRSIVLQDASGYNYSSGRLDKQATDRMIEVEQFQLELKVLAKIWDAWLSEASKIYGFLPSPVEDGLEMRPRWLWRRLGHVDRKKEADGVMQELANNTTTLAAECAANGEDWEQVLRQRAVEKARLAELGLFAANPPLTKAAETPQTEESENENAERTPQAS